MALAAGPAGKPIKIAILSDIHVYDPALGTTGSAFESYLASQDNKLEPESVAIFQSALNILLKSDAQVVLIAGDLTNNGEYVSHQLVASYLDRLVRPAGRQLRKDRSPHRQSNAVNRPPASGEKEIPCGLP